MRTFGRNDQTAPLRCSAINGLDDIDHLYPRISYLSAALKRQGGMSPAHLLLVLHSPITEEDESGLANVTSHREADLCVHLIIVTRAQIYHNMLIAYIKCVLE